MHNASPPPPRARARTINTRNKAHFHQLQTENSPTYNNNSDVASDRGADEDAAYLRVVGA